VNKPVVLSSKSFVRTKKILDDVQISLQQLQVKKIDIYHLHNISSLKEYDKAMGLEGPMRD